MSALFLERHHLAGGQAFGRHHLGHIRRWHGRGRPRARSGNPEQKPFGLALRGQSRRRKAVPDFPRDQYSTTWFVPGLVAEKHRASVREVAAAGHDVESHGWGFERYDEMPRASSLELLKRSRQVLENVTGKPVTGFRLPIGNWPDQFDGLLKEAGYLWSASLNGDDVPYLHASGLLLEIPVHLELEDRPYFQFNFTPAFPKGQSRIASYESVLWRTGSPNSMPTGNSAPVLSCNCAPK